MTGTQSIIGAAFCHALERCGKEDNYRVKKSAARMSHMDYTGPSVFISRGMEVVSYDPTSTLGSILLPHNSKKHRRNIMYKLFASPQNAGEASDQLDRLNDLLQFIADLTAMPATPINEYSFSQGGYTGLYYFLVFIQETLAECNAAISQNLNRKGA